jgi:hypothetical protein
MSRWFIRCRSCLLVAALDGQSDFCPPKGRKLNMQCSACKGQIEVMGRVYRDDRLVTDSSRCPCDSRCTSAKGPNCDCSCGGRNHGSNLVVHVVVDAGPIPVVTMPSGLSEAAQQRAGEYAAALARIEALAAELNARRRSSFLSNADFNRMLRIDRVIRKVKDSRTHPGRMKMLAGVA